MKNDILSEYYRPLLERNNFLPIPCPEKFSPAGQCWKIEPEVGGGYYWVHGKQDLYDIKIHDFFFHEDQLLEFHWRSRSASAFCAMILFPAKN